MEEDGGKQGGAPGKEEEVEEKVVARVGAFKEGW